MRWVLALIAAGLLGWLVIHTVKPDWYARIIYPLKHHGLIVGEAASTGLAPELIAAVIYRESQFDEDARSDKGAVGLMQVLPETAEWIHRQPGAPGSEPGRLAEPAVNIAYGSWYLRYLIDKYSSDELGLAAYNGGETNVQKWVAEAREKGRQLRISEIPFAETRGFVDEVSNARIIYRRIWRESLIRD